MNDQERKTYQRPRKIVGICTTATAQDAFIVLADDGTIWRWVPFTETGWTKVDLSPLPTD